MPTDYQNGRHIFAETATTPNSITLTHSRGGTNSPSGGHSYGAPSKFEGNKFDAHSGGQAHRFDSHRVDSHRFDTHRADPHSFQATHIEQHRQNPHSFQQHSFRAA